MFRFIIRTLIFIVGAILCYAIVLGIYITALLHIMKSMGVIL